MNAHAETEIIAQLLAGYHAPRLFQDSQTSSYSGATFGGSLLYRLSSSAVSIAPIVTYQVGTYQNSANTSLQTETITDKTINAGLRAYFDKLYVQAHYSWIKLTDTAQGTVDLNIYDRVTGIGGSVGVELPLSRFVRLEVSLDASSYQFNQKTGGFSADTQYLKYGGHIGINFLLPSAPAAKKFEFESL